MLVLASAVRAQDQPSLGDVARQARQQKQQNKDPQKKDAEAKPSPATKPARVITEEELPEHPVSDGASSPADEKDQAGSDSASAAPQAKLSADEWRSRILSQKNAVNGLQSNIDDLEKSIQFAPGNCVSGCVEWNQHQKEKQQEVERMKGQLETAKKQLEDMQDAARQQGYGSSVYEP